MPYMKQKKMEEIAYVFINKLNEIEKRRELNMTILGLDEVLKLIVGWEQKMDTFYGLMEKNLKNERSQKAAAVLRKEQRKTLDVLEAIDTSSYKNVEMVKNLPDYHSEEVLPHYDISENSSPMDVFQTILNYEEKLEEYYVHLKSVLVYEKSKDLLDMLINFKMGQIKEIKALMDSFDLAV